MTDVIYLMVYFFSYAAGFAALTVNIFALCKDPSPLLRMYLVFLSSSVFFLLVRNLGFFLKMFLGVLNLEQTPGLYVIYMISCSALAFAYVGLATELKSKKNNVPGIAVAGIFALVPLAYIALLAGTMDAEFPGVARLLHINKMMGYTYSVVIIWLLFLLVFRRRMKDLFRRKLTDAILVNGGLYFIFATLQWLTYKDQNYSLYPFSMINVNLTMVFISSAYLIGRKYLVSTSARAESANTAALPELSDSDNSIISRIHRGETNKEIAAAMGLSLANVKNAIYRIFNRFDVNSRTELLSLLRAETNENPDEKFSGRTRIV
jgi:DNA-binding CsgD family transcriptional regulator